MNVGFLSIRFGSQVDVVGKLSMFFLVFELVVVPFFISTRPVLSSGGSRSRSYWGGTQTSLVSTIIHKLKDEIQRLSRDCEKIPVILNSPVVLTNSPDFFLAFKQTDLGRKNRKINNEIQPSFFLRTRSPLERRLSRGYNYPSSLPL
jgi:hypothetical protein